MTNRKLKTTIFAIFFSHFFAMAQFATVTKNGTENQLAIETPTYSTVNEHDTQVNTSVVESEKPVLKLMRKGEISKSMHKKKQDYIASKIAKKRSPSTQLSFPFR